MELKRAKKKPGGISLKFTREFSDYMTVTYTRESPTKLLILPCAVILRYVCTCKRVNRWIHTKLGMAWGKGSHVGG